MVMRQTLEYIQRKEAEIEAARRAAEQHQQRPQEVVVKVNAVPQTQASNTHSVRTQHNKGPGELSVKSTGGGEQREQVHYRPMPSSLEHHEKSLWHRVADYVKTDDVSKILTILYGVTATGIVGVMSFTVLWSYLEDRAKEAKEVRPQNVVRDNEPANLQDPHDQEPHNDDGMNNGDRGGPEMPTLDRKFAPGFSLFEPGSFGAPSSFRPIELNTEMSEGHPLHTSSAHGLIPRSYEGATYQSIQMTKGGVLYNVVNYGGLSPRGHSSSLSWYTKGAPKTVDSATQTTHYTGSLYSDDGSVCVITDDIEYSESLENFVSDSLQTSSVITTEVGQKTIVATTSALRHTDDISPTCKVFGWNTEGYDNNDDSGPGDLSQGITLEYGGVEM
ncbi:hypothetical protein EDM53_04215 [Rickettsiales endosymbiont of Peranema trichophorum]|uniref:hypothetical protein n=1 Tax=Rickettsiales endosymbiont of Peranema trichophorum TaxID=2486577 RepID=UPI001023D9E6|nr:hypothetical protein [Rickettsiales endosymbiont of Peranema trichophorum]RZI46334.1 hypothetical protein EDM53_04215 [Rickettsiales endosymbiont of Peranema trichophorum]